MAYDINAALERLENNLAKVESAKKQVEETIATSESLQQIIGRYTESLSSMGKDISAFIEEIRNYQGNKTSELGSAVDKIKTSCECVINKFNADVKTAIKSFDEKFAETIVKFGSENEKLRFQVNKLEEVNEVEKKVDILATELKNSQESQDETLESVKSSLETLPSSVKSHAEVIVSEVKNRALDLKAKSEEIIGDVSKAVQKLDNQISVMAETKELCNAIKEDIEKLKGSIDSQFESMRSAININRWIAIIGILALIGLHFI